MDLMWEERSRFATTYSSTTEVQETMIPQQLIAAKSQQLHQIVDQIVAIVSAAVAEQTPIHEVESKTFETFLHGGRIALQLLVDCLGDGDMGPEHQLPDGTRLQRSAQPQPRPYLSIFGELNIQQYVYAEREGQQIKFAAIAAALGLAGEQILLPVAGLGSRLRHGSTVWQSGPARCSGS